MSYTWFINLERRVDRKEFDEAAKEAGIEFSPDTIGGNIYYDMRKGCVEIDFGGLEQKTDNNSSATQITVSTVYCDGNAYKIMKKTVLSLAKKLPFKSISGDWINNIAKQDNATKEFKPVPYRPSLFKLLEKK
jgi:hypothetical protein